MKKFSLLLLVLLSACADIDYRIEQMRPNEYYGAGYEHLNGRLFQVYCNGVSDSDSGYVKKRCLEETAAFCAVNGYDYFTLLSEENQSNQEMYSYRTYDRTHFGTTTIHNVALKIMLIGADELTQHKNYYRVSDYNTSKTN